MNPFRDAAGAPLDTLIAALQNPALYDPPVHTFQIIETHISYVLLAGDYAYKIKKPLDLGFLDFSTLDKRRHYCQEEWRLNRRLAPELYLGVAAITGTPEQPQWDGAGPVLEYAVKMRQFPQSALLGEIAAHGGLRPRQLIRLAKRIAAFHRAVAPAPANTSYGAPASVIQPALQNFSQIAPLLDDETERLQLDALRVWSEREFLHLTPFFRRRKAEGCIRECHGDLHTGNMVLLDDEITVFDCIEFNDNLRWIDILNDIAFLVMDLIHRRQPDEAAAVLNAWLEDSGDYGGLAGLRFYLTYRALVRAKVAALRAVQPESAAREAARQWRDYRAYAALAERLTRRSAPFLAITRGLSGSGKSTLSQPLAASLGAVRIRSDVERKRLFGLPADARSESAPGGGLYTPAAGRQTYQRLMALGRETLAAGYPVILDAAFLQRDQREMARRLADACDVPFVILDIQADAHVLRARIRQRTAAGGDASEAGLPVLERQIASQEPLDAEEQCSALAVDAETTAAAALAETVRAFLKRPSPHRLRG